MRQRIIIVALMTEGYSIVAIKIIMMGRHDIGVSKRGIPNIVNKFKIEGIYNDRESS